MEMLADAEKKQVTIDLVVAAIGGGGLISGTAAYLKEKQPKIKVVGAEPVGAASMQAAFDHQGPVALEHIETFVDGAAVKQVGAQTYAHAKRYVDQLVAVEEGAICQTILELYSKQAIVAEPAGALSVAALDLIKEQIKGKTVVCIVSGGNNDSSRMAEIEEKSLIYQGLKHYFIVNFPQRPGALKEFVSHVLGPDDDITRFEYTKKINRGTGPVMLGILLKHKKDLPALLSRIEQFDKNYINLQQNQSLYSLLV